MCESFFGTLESELLMREHFDTHEQARGRLFWFIEGWYNLRRLHSSIGYRSPLEFEDEHTKINSCRPAGCPPPGGVVVVIGDPPPARGQPATYHLTEVKSHINRYCRSVRRNGATSNAKRIKISLGSLSPLEYRESLGLAA